MFGKQFFAASACVVSLLVASPIVRAEAPAATGIPFAWGYDGMGQLGDDASWMRVTPQPLAGVPAFSAAAAGSSHALALAQDGTVWTWGLNVYGQLGDGTLTSRSTAAPVAGLGGVVSVAAGSLHSLALKSDGTVWAWGMGGMTGNGAGPDQHSPVQVVGLANVVAVSACQSFSLALKSDGTVWAWGSNPYGQLGDGTTVNRTSPVQVTSLGNIVSISAGSQHGLAVRGDGTVWAWGRNTRGQLGDGTNVSRPSPVQVLGLSGFSKVSAGGLFSMAWKADGTVWAWGHGGLGELGNGSFANSWTAVQVSGLTGVTRISAGYTHALAATSTGSVYAWGSDSYGECAQGVGQRHNLPLTVGGVSGAQFVAASSNWSLCGGSTTWTWGRNDTGQLGDGRVLSRCTPGRVGTMTDVRALAGGEFSALALMADGTVWGWGNNELGQLGTGTFSFSEAPTPVVGLSDVTAIAAGPDHSLALKSDGTVWAWGDNGRGELGNGTWESTSTPVQVQGLTGVTAIEAGWDFSLALASDGRIWSWGASDLGALGDGSGSDQCSPVQVSGISSAVAIAAENYSQSCLAVMADGTVRSWGANGAGQLGDGTTTMRTTPVTVLGLSGVASVATGAWAFSLARKSDGTVWAWGANNRGQLGTGTTTSSLLPIRVPGLTGVTALRAGDTHTLALKSDGTVWAWGVNWFGHTGQSSTADQPVPIQVPGVTGAVAVAAGGDYSMALLTCALTCSATVPSTALENVPVPFASTASLGLACPGGPPTYTYAWEFGDGATSTEQNPSHTYATYGQYAWTMTATAGSETCRRTGVILITPCTLTCSASVDRTTGDTATVFTFSSTVLHPDCPGTPAVDWDFGDGSPHGSGAGVVHTYSQEGTYTWVMRATLGPVPCTQTGQVFVTAPSQASVQGSVGIFSAGALWPFNTEPGTGGISGLQVYAVAQGDPTHVPASISGSTFTLSGLTPGTSYNIYASFDYADHITQSNDDLAGYGCAAPGTLVKHVVSPALSATPVQGSTRFANIGFSPPLVMLHGIQDCYTRWYSSDSADTARWDNAARNEGFITFTPNFTWWLPAGSWGQSSDQVLSQIQSDLTGLVGTPPSNRPGLAPTPTSWPPYVVVAHDMGGLMVRVLTSGVHRNDASVKAMAAAFLIGVPNSGTDVALGGGPDNILSTQGIVQSFNEIYPDFGDKTGSVYAIGGDLGWWGLKNSDGVVSVASAFTVARLACSDDGSGGSICHAFPYLTFNSDPAAEHAFGFDHMGLVTPPAQPGVPSSTDEILRGVILPAVRADLLPVAQQDPVVVGDPHAPISSTIWGTTIRHVGQTSGSSHQSPEQVQGSPTSYPFYISDTDGMAVVAFVSEGSATLAVVDPNGTTVASRGGVSGNYSYTQLAPPASTQAKPWTLVVTPDAGGATFQASFFENGVFGTNGYLTQHTYAPGAPVTLRVDLEGDLSEVSVAGVTAQVPWTGNPVTLVQVGSASYAATVAAPPGGGSYPVLFETTGTYLQNAPFTRWNYDSLDVLPPARLFTGSFSDAPVDRSGDGFYDAIRFTAPVVSAAGGYFLVSGDLFDSSGNFLDHTSATQEVPAGSQATPFLLTFDLTSANCVQFSAPFSVQNLQVVDGATLLPLDGWTEAIPTASYAGTSFLCRQGIPQPVLTSVQPIQGAAGQQFLTLLVAGHGFIPGAALSLGLDITVNGVERVNDTLLKATLSIPVGATLGPHDVTVTNTGGTAVTLPGAFLVLEDRPPSVSIESIGGLLAGNVLPPSPGPVTVTASAADDGRVTSVDFLLDDGSGNFTVKSTVSAFPFIWAFDPGTVPHGAHAIKARAHDDAGLTADSASITIYSFPPTVTSVTGGGSPWQLKILGTNFLSGATVTIGSDAQPWSNVKLKSSTQLVVKGGKTLKSKFPSGQAVPISIRNADGAGVTTSYTRH